MNLKALPGRTFYNVIYTWAAQRVEDIDKFEAELDMPLPGSHTTRVDQQTIDAENAALMKFAAEAKGR